MSFSSNMNIPSHNKSYNGNMFTNNSYLNSSAMNSGVPMPGNSAHPGLQYLHAFQQPQQPTSLHPQQTTQDYYTVSSTNNTLSSGSASSTAPTSINDMPLSVQQQSQQSQQQQQQSVSNPGVVKTIMPQMISGTGASSNPPMPLDPAVTTKFTNNDIQVLRQLLIAGEKFKWKQITKEINTSTNHTQHVMAAMNKNSQHLSQLQQNSIASHHLQHQHQQSYHHHHQQQRQQQQQQQMHQQQLSYEYQQQQQQPQLQNSNSMHKSNSMHSPYMPSSAPTNSIRPHQTLNMPPNHATPASISPHSNSHSHTHLPPPPPNPVPLKNVSPTFVMKQYQQLLGLPSNMVYFGTLGSSLPYVIAANGWSDIDQEAYNYPFNLDDDE